MEERGISIGSRGASFELLAFDVYLFIILRKQIILFNISCTYNFVSINIFFNMIILNSLMNFFDQGKPIGFRAQVLCHTLVANAQKRIRC